MLLALMMWGCGPPAPGVLLVEIEPVDAALVLDGEPVQAGTFTLERGPHALAASRTGFAPYADELILESGDQREVRIALEPQLQPLALHTDPADAAVWIDDQLVGSGIVTTQIPAGPHRIEVRRNGMRSEVEELFVDGPVERWVALEMEGQLLDRLGSFSTCSQPKGVLLHPSKPEVWVSCLNGPPSVVVHALPTGEQLASLSLGEHGAVELAFSDDGAHVYASQMETHRVYDIDAEAREQVAVFDTRSNWSKVIELSADGEHLFVANWNFDDVSELDRHTGELVRRIPTVRTPRGLYATPDGASLYVAGFGTGELAQIDLQTGESRIVWREGKNLRHLVGSPDGRLLYLSDMGLRAVFVRDLQSGETRRLADADANTNTIDLTDDAELLLVSNRGTNGPGGYLTVGKRGSVLVIDTETGELLDAIAAGHQPTALDVRGDLLVHSDFRDDRLHLWRIPSRAMLRQGGGGRRDVYRDELSQPEAVTLGWATR